MQKLVGLRDDTFVGGGLVPISKTTLNTAIGNATILFGSKTVGTAVGQVPQATHDAFQAVINAATAVKNDANATQLQVDAQVTTLASATTNFNNAVITGALDTTAPDVHSASAQLGWNTVNAVKQTDGSWQLEFSTSADSALFTDMNIVADPDTTQVEMSITLTGGTIIKKTFQFSNGVSNVNIHEMFGVLDLGEPGLSIANIRTLGLATFTAELKDAAYNKRTVNINLKLEVEDTTAPEITLAEAANVNVANGAAYTDAGATALDNKDGVLTVVTTITNNINAGTI
jgi:hypothetical protein